MNLILRSMWPKRAHLEDVHVGVVELIGLGDEACPVIPRIKGLLRGVAMEMSVSCCLCSTHTPAHGKPKEMVKIRTKEMVTGGLSGSTDSPGGAGLGALSKPKHPRPGPP